MTREEAIERFNGIINAMSISIAQSKFYPSKAELDELCDMAIEALSADTIPIEKYHELQHDFVMLGATFADLTEVVRCKDCRHCKVGVSENYYGSCRWFNTHSVNADDFCSYGERAEQTEYKLPGHDEVMEALDKLTLRGDDND